MILIFDDTFPERKADYPLNFLDEKKFQDVVKIITKVKGNQVKSFENEIQSSTCIAYHRTMKFYGNSGNLLPNEKNIVCFEHLEKLIHEAEIPNISFSGSNSITKQIGKNKLTINKSQFYFNLQDFLEYFIDEQELEFKVLTFGKNWIGYELSFIQSKINAILAKELLAGNSNFTQASTALLEELHRFNNIAKLKSEPDWLLYLTANQPQFVALQSFLDRTVKSYIKYGKYIYNL